jgi:hypothetical protein
MLLLATRQAKLFQATDFSDGLLFSLTATHWSLEEFCAKHIGNVPSSFVGGQPNNKPFENQRSEQVSNLVHQLPGCNSMMRTPHAVVPRSR